MRKLVLSIALVVCLDIAFIWMMANQPEPVEISFAVTPHAAVPVVYEPRSIGPVSIDDDIESSEYALGPAERVTRELREDGRPSRSSKNAEPPAERVEAATFEDPSFQAKRLFPDKIIVIGQSEPIAETPLQRIPQHGKASHDIAEVLESVQDDTSEAKKRSFESRALGMIKKPYTWVRTLAAKLRQP